MQRIGDALFSARELAVERESPFFTPEHEQCGGDVAGAPGGIGRDEALLPAVSSARLVAEHDRDVTSLSQRLRSKDKVRVLGACKRLGEPVITLEQVVTHRPERVEVDEQAECGIWIKREQGRKGGTDVVPLRSISSSTAYV